MYKNKSWFERTFANIWLTIGWLLFVKVSYTYYWVSTSDPGTPKQAAESFSKKEELSYEPNSYVPAVPDSYYKNYGNQMVELLRYTPILHSEQNCISEVMKEKGYSCDKCQYLKPLRTHHCSVCKKCVLLMDHHCMWTNNCIGMNNHKQFL